ncbi:efflux transporter, RND family, MFP subunit [Gemmatirosa kalamazoonensis]|uniref:Efflux transporter, RND family, MFP subunit n=1 Tax=Gemmatirosa kalamazoonensis TaxID=861299 RepID=W0RJF7_9BACT|nr:efflux RND transporter periplasmic adaptor subunit [Gemmatirosa kalamazoonensis]AHG89553.1 efflux transporter, RND family, MFP subunit [Gemmatirosa kalamazoonensis]
MISTTRSGRGARPSTYILTALALTSLGALAACSKSGAAPDTAAAAAAAAAMTVGSENIAVVTMDSIQSGPAISGSLQPERQATIRAEASGTVTQTFAEAGQRVGAGAVLARIETTGIADQAIAARANVTSARVAYETAQRNAERANRLLAAGAIAERDAETARSQAQAAQAQLSAAEAQSANAQRLLGNTTVRAPFAGIVGARSVSTGDVVSVGSAMFTVVDPSSMQLQASVPADQLSQVRVGAPVRFTVSGYPGRAFNGRITRVAPVADPTTKQVQIIASVPNAGNALVGGLFAEGRVASEGRTALVAPNLAIDQRSTTPAVVRVKNGKVERVNVELGLRDDARERVEIRAGVQAGDTLLIGAAQGISAGTPVRVAAPVDAPRVTR